MLVWQREDILSNYCALINFEVIKRLRLEKMSRLDRPHWQPLRTEMSKLPFGSDISGRSGRLLLNLEDSLIQIGQSDDLTATEQYSLKEVIRLLIPWRKGPFLLFGEEIDAEWRSDFKWKRIEPLLGSLDGLRIADIGCNNGYYMLRALSRGPECVVGFDPSEAFYYSFELLQRFVQNPSLQYEPLGVEQMGLFPEFFDLVFCLGILYHHRNPIQLLQGIKDSMKPGGKLIVESQAIAGEEPVALFAPDRYAKARNVYFIPTASCLEAWLCRAGFVDVELCSDVKLMPSEQRRTALAPYESLSDFLDPEDSEKTIEGYPAPRRVVMQAKKRDII